MSGEAPPRITLGLTLIADENRAAAALRILTTCGKAAISAATAILILCVLALIECGLATPYDLQIGAGLSPRCSDPRTPAARVWRMGFAGETRSAWAHRASDHGGRPTASAK